MEPIASGTMDGQNWSEVGVRNIGVWFDVVFALGRIRRLIHVRLSSPSTRVIGSNRDAARRPLKMRTNDGAGSQATQGAYRAGCGYDRG